MKKIHTFGILLMMILLGSCISSQAGFTNEQLLSIRKGDDAGTGNRCTRFTFLQDF